MDLNFKQDSKGLYRATAAVNGDFNVHLEREASGTLIMTQRTAGTKGASFYNEVAPAVVDDDFGGNVYPKTIEVISSTPVLVGIITEA